VQLSVPIQKDDGSVAFTATFNEEQIKAMMEFAMNMIMAMGLSHQFNIMDLEDMETDDELSN
jgi:hypothetical protein